jgi:hypothetical protein
MYIGKTVKGVKKRMTGYKTPGPTQFTNINNRKRILACLTRLKTLDIFVLPDNGPLRYGGFHINLAARLEDDLVRDLAPPWNGGLKKTAKQTLAPTKLA